MRKFLLLLVLVLLPTAAMAERPFAALLAAAEGGERAAMLATGVAYYEGNGVDQDCYEARSWLKKRAVLAARLSRFCSDCEQRSARTLQITCMSDQQLKTLWTPGLRSK